jgi:hypothetical protein
MGARGRKTRKCTFLSQQHPKKAPTHLRGRVFFSFSAPLGGGVRASTRRLACPLLPNANTTAHCTARALLSVTCYVVRPIHAIQHPMPCVRRPQVTSLAGHRAPATTATVWCAMALRFASRWPSPGPVTSPAAQSPSERMFAQGDLLSTAHRSSTSANLRSADMNGERCTER